MPPIDTAEGAYKVTEGNKPAAVRLMQELEIQTLITRFGLDGIVPEQDPDTLPEVDAAIASLPAEPSGHYLVAARPAVLGKKKRGRAAGGLVRRAGHHRVSPLRGGTGLPAGRPQSNAGCIRFRPPLRQSHGRRQLGQQHRLGRQAGRLPAGRFRFPLSAHHPCHQLPCKVSVLL